MPKNLKVLQKKLLWRDQAKLLHIETDIQLYKYINKSYKNLNILNLCGKLAKKPKNVPTETPNASNAPYSADM